jgi:hypothetical protein
MQTICVDPVIYGVIIILSVNDNRRGAEVLESLLSCAATFEKINVKLTAIMITAVNRLLMVLILATLSVGLDWH